MAFIRKNLLAVGGGVVVILGLVYYFMFSGGSSAPLLSSTADTAAAPVSQTLLVTLTNLHTIKLDTTIFQDPVFLSLSDFGVIIPLQPVGRRNPFASIGAAVVSPAASTITNLVSPSVPATR